MTGDVSRRAALRTAGLLGLGAAAGPPAVRPAPGTDQAPPLTTQEIPVGGGKVYPKDNLVVTQPTAGDFRGFSATCTHSGCKVAEVRDGAIHCYCHGSRFRIDDGSVATGPALLPLPPQAITVEKGTIRRKR